MPNGIGITPNGGKEPEDPVGKVKVEAHTGIQARTVLLYQLECERT